MDVISWGNSKWPGRIVVIWAPGIWCTSDEPALGAVYFPVPSSETRQSGHLAGGNVDSGRPVPVDGNPLSGDRGVGRGAGVVLGRHTSSPGHRQGQSFRIVQARRGGIRCRTCACEDRLVARHLGQKRGDDSIRLRPLIAAYRSAAVYVAHRLFRHRARCQRRGRSVPLTVARRDIRYRQKSEC